MGTIPYIAGYVKNTVQFKKKPFSFREKGSCVISSEEYHAGFASFSTYVSSFTEVCLV
jgi:hypothetical protein